MDLNALKVFVKVAELLSFTRAARALGITQSGASRAVARLEAEMRIALLNRSTHALGLTPDGEFLYRAAHGVLQQLEETEQQLNGRTCVPEGELRITTPSAYGRMVVMPLLQAMMQRYPRLTVDAVMTDRQVDIVEEGFDAALRIGPVEEQLLVARKIKDLRLVTVASPDFLRRCGTPQTPAALAGFNCLVVKGQKNGRRTDWLFRDDGEELRIAAQGTMTVDSADVLLDAALCGSGLVQIMDFAAEPLIAAGRLVEVLADYSVITRPLSLIYTPSRHRSPKITALLQAFGVDLPPPVSAAQAG